MLDASPLGALAHPRANREIVRWLESMMTAGVRLMVPEIADYEVRRSLLLSRLHHSLGALDQLKSKLIYVPITTAVILESAELWADARRRGTPTADPKELDCDVILAAQALAVGAVVATENVGHLGRYVTARNWRAILA